MLNSFINNLSSEKVIELSKLWVINKKKDKIYYPEFTYNDVYHLKKCYYNSYRIHAFYIYYKSLPIDLQLDNNYFKAILYHYNTIYQDKEMFYKTYLKI
mgnify:CR=1 FL=1|jgi:hypothetical protein